MYFLKEVDIQTLITFVFTWRGAYIFKKIKTAKKNSLAVKMYGLSLIVDKESWKFSLRGPQHIIKII